VEVALAAADGNLNVAVEILMSQQVLVHHFIIIYNSLCLHVYLFIFYSLLKILGLVCRVKKKASVGFSQRLT